MGRHLIRDPYRAEFEIDSSALPFWEGREGYEVLGPVEEPAQAEPAAAPVERTSAPITKKAATRPASDSKE
jgi:hypothetical protein